MDFLLTKTKTVLLSFHAYFMLVNFMLFHCELMFWVVCFDGAAECFQQLFFSWSGVEKWDYISVVPLHTDRKMTKDQVWINN